MVFPRLRASLASNPVNLRRPPIDPRDARDPVPARNRTLPSMPCTSGLAPANFRGLAYRRNPRPSPPISETWPTKSRGQPSYAQIRHSRPAVNSPHRRTRGSYGVAGANSSAQARSCSSHGDAPASRAAIILSGSTYFPIGFFANSGELRRCSPDVQQSP